MSRELNDLRRYVARLEFELGRVRETVENQFARIEVLERRLAGQALDDPAVGPLPMTAEHGNMVGFLKGDEGAPQFYVDTPTTGPLQGTPGLGCYSLKGRGSLVLGIAVFDLDLEDMRRVVAMVAENQRRTRGFVPVFLTNVPDFSPFRARKFLYEYFRTEPGLAACMEDERRRRFLQERFRFVLSKWGIGMVVDLSREPGDG